MLIDIRYNCTNIVVCRHKKILFARSVRIGNNQLKDGSMVTRLVMELKNCRKNLSMLYSRPQIDRLVFLSGRAVESEIYTKIAQSLEITAQIGDCIKAVKIPVILNAEQTNESDLSDKTNWVTAFGLSLS